MEQKPNDAELWAEYLQGLGKGTIKPSVKNQPNPKPVKKYEMQGKNATSKRVVSAPAENRTLVVPPETRWIRPDAENRSLTAPAEDH